MDKERMKKIAKWVGKGMGAAVLLLLSGIFVLFGISEYVKEKGSAFIVEASEASAPVIIVPGAGLRPDGTPSDVLRDRLMVALAIYHAGRAEKILCSGDGGKVQYDEVSAMNAWLLVRGVDAEDVLLDAEGFDTYQTMERATTIFGITDAIVVTQAFHLPRALYLANAHGIAVQGVSASIEPYVREEDFVRREVLARIKAWAEVRLSTARMEKPPNI